MSISNPISPKIVAASAGAGAGAVVSTLILWIIGVVAYHIPADAESVSAAVAAVPSPITAAIGLLLVIAGAAIPGYQTTDPNRVVSVEGRPGNGPIDSEITPDQEIRRLPE